LLQFNLNFTIFHPQTCFVVNRRDRHHSLTATPMAALLKDKGAPERERMIMSIADDAASRLDHSMLAGGKLTFPQQSFVMMASLH
jgi:hypothetical protein